MFREFGGVRVLVLVWGFLDWGLWAALGRGVVAEGGQWGLDAEFAFSAPTLCGGGFCGGRVGWGCGRGREVADSWWWRSDVVKGFC